MSDATIAAGYARAMLDFAVAKGIARDILLTRAGIDPDTLASPDNRVTVACYLSLIGAAAELGNEPSIALQFGQAVRMQDISIVGLICEACETTAEVGKQLNRYAALVLDEGIDEPATLIRATWQDDGVWIEGPSDLFAHRYIAEAEFARLVWNARMMFQNSEAFAQLKFPHVIRFKHPAPSYHAVYERVFQAPIVFDAPRNEMRIDPEFFTLRQPPVNRYMFGILSERAETLLKELQASRTTRARVEALLLSILHTGDVGMEAIATKLATSRSSLYRDLKAEGTTFERILDEIRQHLAHDFNSSKKVSIRQTAYLLGFSDAAAFSRAFKRWTGKSPREARGGK